MNDLGLYGKANSLATIPSPIGSMVNKIGFPAFSKIQNEYEKVALGTLRILHLMLLFIVPFSALIIAGGDRVVLIILGSNRLSMVPLLKVLTIAMAINMTFFTVNESVFNSIGKPKIQLYLQGLYSVIFIAGLFTLVPRFGALGAAWAILFGSIIVGLEAIRQLVKTVKLNLHELSKTVAVTIVSTTILSGLGFLFLNMPFFNTTFGFALLAITLGALYAFLILLAGRTRLGGPYKTVLIVIDSFLPKKKTQTQTR